MFGLCCGIGGFVIFAFAPLGSLFLLGIAGIALWGVANPSFQSLMSRRVSALEQGQLQGALGSIRAVTGMIGPVLFTQVFAAAVGTHRVPVLGAAFLLSTVLLVVALLIGVRALPSKREGTPSA
jgi:DHA1 family tetracycline resistance protein-like MFS transporter